MDASCHQHTPLICIPVVCAAVLCAAPAPPAGAERIISKDEVAEAAVLADVRSFAASRRMSQQQVRTALVSTHFYGDFKATYSKEAINYISNVYNKVVSDLNCSRADAPAFVNKIMAEAGTGGYAKYELHNDSTLKRAVWASPEQVLRARLFGLDVLQQVRARKAVRVVVA
jgi:hypothetical protein